MIRPSPKLLFITGTDTGVGKTVFTLCLLRYLKDNGVQVIGLKPFCSGDREDARRLQAESTGKPSLDLINPYYCRHPVAPGVLQKPGYRIPTLAKFRHNIQESAKGYDVVIIEGIGGVLAPVTPTLKVADLIQSLDCSAVVVARDALGTLNHTFLTVAELYRRGIHIEQVVLMKNFRSDPSTKTNQIFLSQQIPHQHFASFPNLSEWPELRPNNSANRIIFKKTLARFRLLYSFCIRRCEIPNRNGKRKSKATQPSGLLKVSKAR